MLRTPPDPADPETPAPAGAERPARAPADPGTPAPDPADPGTPAPDPADPETPAPDPAGAEGPAPDPAGPGTPAPASAERPVRAGAERGVPADPETSAPAGAERPAPASAPAGPEGPVRAGAERSARAGAERGVRAGAEPPTPAAFPAADAAAVYRAMRLRRDMRHFRPDPVPPDQLARLLRAAHTAPSVGYMQPWRFVRVAEPGLRRALHGLVEDERRRTAEALGERRAEFLRLKVEGILDCGEVLVVALTDGRERYVFGRRTLPEMDVASAACAIQNLWLAARVEGLGLGWVSLFDPDAVARLLGMPGGARPLAILCLGAVDGFYERPMLEDEGWDERRRLADLVWQDRWDGPVAPEVRDALDG